MTSPQLLWLPFSHTSRYSNTPGVSGSSLQVLKSTVHLHGHFITSAIQFENLEFNRLFSTEDSLSTRVVGIYIKNLGCDWLVTNKIRTWKQPKPSFVTGILGGGFHIPIYTHISDLHRNDGFKAVKHAKSLCHFMQVRGMSKTLAIDIRDMFTDKVLVSRCLLQEVLKDVYEIRQFRAICRNK